MPAGWARPTAHRRIRQLCDAAVRRRPRPRPTALVAMTALGSLALCGITAGLVWFSLGGDAQPAWATPVCENGTVIPNPSAQPLLVADCETLLSLADELRGSAPLDWNPARPLDQWRGVELGGQPPRVRRLDLSQLELDGAVPAALGELAGLQRLLLDGNSLSGPIPPQLGRLRQLVTLNLSGNRLSGPIPAELGQLRQLELLYLGGNRLSGPIPPELGHLDRILALGLQDNQLSGGLPDALAELWTLRDLYLDDNLLSGPLPYWLDDLGLQSLFLAGNPGLTGCRPAELQRLPFHDLDRLGLDQCPPQPTVTLTTEARLDDRGRILPPPGRHSVRRGARVLLRAVPFDDSRVAAWSGACSGRAQTCVVTMEADRWVGVRFERLTHSLTVAAGAGGSVSPFGRTEFEQPTTAALTASWNDATHTFAGWSGACSGTETTCELLVYDDLEVAAAFTPLPADRCAEPEDADCIRAVYLGAPDDYAQVQDIPAARLLTPDSDGRYQVERGQQVTVVTAAPLPEGWTRFYLQRGPAGEPRPVSQERLVRPTGTSYTFTVAGDEEAATLITYRLTAARPLPVQRPGIKPELGADVVATSFQVAGSTLRYGSYDASGAVTAPGSFAFLSDPDDSMSAVATYEGLRDGSTAALLIHQSDQFGAGQAQLYDAIAVDDLFEWHQADDCFVRYRVTEVGPDPAVAEPRKLLAVDWMTYAFTGCSGTIPADAGVWFRWGELADLGGTSLTVPVVHGPFQIVPEGWTGATQAAAHVDIPHQSASLLTSKLVEARSMAFWRDPQLPAGWSLTVASSGDPLLDPVHGYCAVWANDRGYRAVEICGQYLVENRAERDASWNDGRGVVETRVLDGRTAILVYSPRGRNHNAHRSIQVWVFDQATSTLYTIRGYDDSLTGSETGPALVIATSLFGSGGGR